MPYETGQRLKLSSAMGVPGQAPTVRDLALLAYELVDSIRRRNITG